MDFSQIYDEAHGMLLISSISCEEYGEFTEEEVQQIIETESERTGMYDWAVVQRGLVPLALHERHDGEISVRKRAASFVRIVLEKAIELTPAEFADDESLGIKPAMAKNVLGHFYYDGTLGEQNYDKSRAYFEDSAKLGIADSILNLGYFHEYGRGVEKDPERAYHCFTRAYLLDPSVPEARYKVADMYFDGLGVEKNESFAVGIYESILDDTEDDEWFKRNKESLYRRLARAYDEGKGTERDAAKALEYYEKLEIIHYRDLATGRPVTPYYNPAEQLDSVQKRIVQLRRELNIDSTEVAGFLSDEDWR